MTKTDLVDSIAKSAGLTKKFGEVLSIGDCLITAVVRMYGRSGTTLRASLYIPAGHGQWPNRRLSQEALGFLASCL